MLLACASCSRKYGPQAAYDHAYSVLRHGDLKRAEDEAHRGCQRYKGSNPEWTWRFRTLEANSVLQQGRYEDTLKLLKAEPLPSSQPDLAIPILWLQGEADLETHDFSEAERSLNEASELCKAFTSARCGYVLKARGLLAAERNELESAERLYELSLAFARSHSDKLLEALALLNLGNASLQQGRLDESIDRSEAACEAAQAAGARRLELITRGNIAWAYYKLGDYEKALPMASEARDLASQLGDIWNEEEALINIGDIYMDEGKLEQAAQSFQHSLELARGINAKDDIYGNLRVLARLSLQTGDLANASQYAQQAVEMARQDKNHLNELYPMLVQGQIAASRNDSAAAESTFRDVESDKDCPIFLKWEAEHSLARLYEDESKPDAAGREYRTALATFETARDTVRREDSQLSFLTNASRIYDDYIHFLVTHNKTDEAVRWADNSRARTLSEGLGLLQKGVLQKGANDGPPPLNPPQIARQARGTVFFYWLGERQSYLWAVTPQKAALFPLPPRAQIEEAAERYRKSLTGPQSGLESAGQQPDRDGLWLYRTLIEPAQALLRQGQPKQASSKEDAKQGGAKDHSKAARSDPKVFIIPDGALNNLNFETLIVPESLPHYWIDDVSIVNVSSLRMLASSARASSMVASSTTGESSPSRKLLLIGDSVSPSPDYPELPHAADQMTAVAKRFPKNQQTVMARAQATPAAYESSHPEQFSYIHFVAHGTASLLSPLDSAIILSKDGENKDGDNVESFKLYARKIKDHPLHAELVTISACYSAGERLYAGEGLVGLAWAFLRAGAHNVIAASWEATDASTQQLMDTFYDALNRGVSPDVALRKAKLSLLHSDGVFRKPHYWAPFQLYTGSLPHSSTAHDSN